MLTNPTIETLKSLKLHGMLQALEEQQQTPAIQVLSFEERIALIVDRERLYRDNQRKSRLLRGAHLKVAAACIEDIITKPLAASTRSKSPRSPRANGSADPKTYSSPARQVAGRLGFRVRSPSNVVAKALR
jgi:hypothetical protein